MCVRPLCAAAAPPAREPPPLTPAVPPRRPTGNLYGGNVNQQVIMDIMTGMLDKSRTVDGVPTSLKDLGYSVRQPRARRCARARARSHAHAHALPPPSPPPAS